MHRNGPVMCLVTHGYLSGMLLGTHRRKIVFFIAYGWMT